MKPEKIGRGFGEIINLAVIALLVAKCEGWGFIARVKNEKEN